METRCVHCQRAFKVAESTAGIFCSDHCRMQSLVVMIRNDLNALQQAFRYASSLADEDNLMFRKQILSLIVKHNKMISEIQEELTDGEDSSRVEGYI